jgi:uncharacterized protein YprB with RNaseH-like and TPR domain
MSGRKEADREVLRRRLSRLGGKSSRSRKTQGVSRVSDPDERLGQPVETPLGTAFVIEERFSLDHNHGNRLLKDYFGFNADLAAEVARDSGLAEVDPGRLMFVDTETTGLVGGAGTIAFLIGVGLFEQEDFVLRQFFLHEPGEEAAMLHSLQTQLEAVSGFISFNGKVFDLPLMEMRFRMGLRQSFPVTAWPHLDLLFPARRLWRRALPDCSLGTLEKHILGVERSGEDVPGEWIPGIYQDYLRTGDLTEVRRVIYHNKVDILSLVGLAVEVLSRHDRQDAPPLTGAEALGVARWHERAGREKSARKAFLAAVESEEKEVRSEALRHWTAHLKRSRKRKEAVSFWEEWHHVAEEDPRPCVELSKYYEWHAKDLERAAEWAHTALLCLSHWPAGWRRDRAWQEVEHRIARIGKKKAVSEKTD